MIEDKDNYFMKIALQEAKKAFDEDEVPVGCVIVINGQIIGRGYNQTEKLLDVTAHAEIIAITSAANHLGSKFLNDCTMYVTLEPCVMCAGAIHWSRIARLVYAAQDPKKGFISAYGLKDQFSKLSISEGVEREPASQLLVDFFRNKRNLL